MKTKFILEVGSNHNCDIKRIDEFMRDAKSFNCFGIKFQLFVAEKLYHKDYIPKNFKQRELPISFIPIIREMCDYYDLKFVCTPFDVESALYLSKYIDVYKISSKEILKHDLIKTCADTLKPLIISTGYANKKEIKSALKFCNNGQVTLLHCVTDYPCEIRNCDLNRISWLRYEFRDCKIGYSDHSANESVLYQALIMQSEIIEFHYDIDGQGWEFDKGHCWTKETISKIIKNIEIGEQALTTDIDPTTWYNKRLERADKNDGLRPCKEARREFSKR